MGAGNPQAVLSALTDTGRRIKQVQNDLARLIREEHDLIDRARQLGVAEHVIQNHRS